RPDLYFVPPYVGNRGWLGVRLDRRMSWAEIDGTVENAYLAVCMRGSQGRHTKKETATKPSGGALLEAEIVSLSGFGTV
ncbi:MAG TPA: hypothetical protein VIJ36_02665, partial [Thermoanaerobaculia bacterium]